MAHSFPCDGPCAVLVASRWRIAKQKAPASEGGRYKTKNPPPGTWLRGSPTNRRTFLWPGATPTPPTDCAGTNARRAFCECARSFRRTKSFSRPTSPKKKPLGPGSCSLLAIMEKKITPCLEISPEQSKVKKRMPIIGQRGVFLRG